MICGISNSSVYNDDPSLAWYAIYTRHQHEKTVARILTIKGFEILLPLYPVTSRWKDRTKLLSLPLFPCYVFLKGGLDRRLDIMTTPGIHALVSNAGQPAAIPPAEIEAVRRAVESGSRIEPHPFLKCGEWVRVKCGPLEGIQGILVRKKNLYRLVLSVEMLGEAAAVEVDAFLVERVNGKPSGVHGSGYAAASTHAGPRTVGFAN
ncbi:MAG: UpxY family transcription antiterminator [Candidatus Acidiferrales bacterium]